MSHAQSNPDSIHDGHEYGRDDRHPALTPLVIDLIPDQTQAELEAVIDESLAVERFGEREDSESDSHAASDSGGSYHD